jgi:hypothetical protein
MNTILSSKFKKNGREYKKLVPLPMSKNIKMITRFLEYFRFMKVKMKIAYEALLHGQTVVEFLIVNNYLFI